MVQSPASYIDRVVAFLAVNLLHAILAHRPIGPLAKDSCAQIEVKLAAERSATERLAAEEAEATFLGLNLFKMDYFVHLNLNLRTSREGERCVVVIDS